MAITNSCWITAGSAGTADFADGSAIAGFRAFATAMENGKTYSYRAESVDRAQWENGAGVYNSGTGVLSRATIYESSSGGKVDFAAPPRVSAQLMAQDVATPARLRAKSAGLLDMDAVKAAAGAYDFGNWTGTVTPDLANVLAMAKAVQTGNVVLGQPTGAEPGFSFTLVLRQDATGGRTLGYNATYWTTSDGAALDIDTTANARNLIFCQVLDDGKIAAAAWKKVA